MSELDETEPNPHGRWILFRDVCVLQLKLMLGNVHNFVLVPATLVAAGIDLVFGIKSGRGRFYRVLDWGRHWEESIGMYSALEHEDEHGLNEDFSVDAVVTLLEGVIIREYEKGGTAASVKDAIDRAIDQLQGEASRRASQMGEAATRITEKLRKPDNA